MGDRKRDTMLANFAIGGGPQVSAAMGELLAERDRLRAVVDAAIAYMDEVPADLIHELAQLDGSPVIGGHAAQRAGQQFLSNACIHEDHSQCEEECPICHDGCACPCHPWNEDTDDATLSAGELSTWSAEQAGVVYAGGRCPDCGNPDRHCDCPDKTKRATCRWCHEPIVFLPSSELAGEEDAWVHEGPQLGKYATRQRACEPDMQSMLAEP